MSPIRSGTVEIMSEGLAYLAEPVEAGKMPAILLIHSFNGLETRLPEYFNDIAKEGYVVLSPQWQTFNKTPADEVMKGLIKESVSYLKTKPDVDANRLGLTGFCAGGRYVSSLWTLKGIISRSSLGNPINFSTICII